MRLIRFAALGAAAAAVTACAGHAPAPDVRYQPVPTPVAVSCVPGALGPSPTGLETKESLAAVPDGPRRYMRLYADWLARVARMTETEPVVQRCRTP